MFEWDEAKREANLRKHGLDFRDSIYLFDGRPMLLIPSPRAEELRFLSVCLNASGFVSTVWTWRGRARRIISMRISRDEERRAYRSIHGG